MLKENVAEGTRILTFVPIFTAKSRFTGSVAGNEEPTVGW